MIAITTGLLSLSYAPALPAVHRPAVLSVRTAARQVSMLSQAGASYVGELPAFDNGTPLGLLEKDAAVVFGMLDEDSDGGITRAEMSAKLSACGYTEERIEIVFGKIDLNADNVISADEFNAAYIKFPTLRTAPGLGGSLQEQLKVDADALFQVLDADSSGTVSEAEIRAHLQACGYEPDFATKIMGSLDWDQSGEIDRDELRKAFVVHPSLRTAPGLGGAR